LGLQELRPDRGIFPYFSMEVAAFADIDLDARGVAAPSERQECPPEQLSGR
jgi:hypothetical protein